MPDSAFFVKSAGGDLAFVSKKAFDGKILEALGETTTTGVVTSVTPANGKTFYLIETRCDLLVAGTSGSSHSANVDLEFATVNEFTFFCQSSDKSMQPVPLRLRGLTLTGNGSDTVALDVQAITGSGATVQGLIVGFVEDTGDDPLL